MPITCTITSGRLRQCKNNVGGNKEFLLGLLTDFQSGVSEDGTTGEIDVLPTATLYRFEVDPTASSLSVTSTTTASPDNGTVFYETAVVARLKKLSAADNKNIQNLTASQLVLFVRDNNNNIWLVGLVNGVDVTAGTFETGNAMGDMSGYTLTFTAREQEMPKRLESYSAEPFDNFGGITVSPAYPTGS
jgi:hypothetical protein